MQETPFFLNCIVSKIKIERLFPVTDLGHLLCLKFADFQYQILNQPSKHTEISKYARKIAFFSKKHPFSENG